MRPDTPQDPELQQIEVLSKPLSYTETGSGRPVVAVHGIPATSRDFRWLDSAFVGRVRFFRLDLPGFGGSPPNDPLAPTFDMMGEAVAAFCEAVGIKDVLVVGHSMGGAIALDAATRTERITALTLVNSSGPKQHRGTFPRTYRFLIGLTDIHPTIRRAMLNICKPIAHRVGFSRHLRDDELVFAMRLASRYNPSVFGKQLRALKKPTFVAWTSHDPAVEPAVSKAIIKCIGEPETLFLEAKTHNLQSSHASELADAIVDWAARTSTNSA